jgi:hypothetical protein
MYRFSNSNAIIADTKLDATLGHSGPTRYAAGCKYAPLIAIG